MCASHFCHNNLTNSNLIFLQVYNLFLQFLSTNEIDWLQLLQHFPLHRLPYFHPEKDPFCFDQAHVLMTFVHSSVHLIFHYQKHHPARKEIKKKENKKVVSCQYHCIFILAGKTKDSIFLPWVPCFHAPYDPD